MRHPFGRRWQAALLVSGLVVAALVAPPSRADSPLGSLGGGTAPAGSPFHAELQTPPESVPAGEIVTFQVILRIPADHYVYEERTHLTVVPTPGIEVVEIQSPTAETKHDTFLDEDVQVHKHDVTFAARLRVQREGPVRLVLESQGCSSTMCFFPQSDTLEARVGMRAATASNSGADADPNKTPRTATSAEASAASRLEAAASRGILWLLLLAFGAGVATSLTPCVYPMIPITIGIIGARSAGRRSKGFTLSLLYVLGIAVTYSALGTSAALTGSLFGGVLQNRWVVVGVALVFAVMAMSLFGAFELQVPVTFASRMNRVQGNGYPGAFLLGLVAGIVASPCIGPVLVAMLAYVAASGSPLLGFALFFTFALGLGLLFLVLGTFTGALASLPRSGAWMTRVRVGFGILFLALALYYLHPHLPHGRVLLPIGILLAGIGLGIGALRRIEATESGRVRWRKALGRVALVGGLYAALVPWVGRRSDRVEAGPTWLVSESAGLTRARADAKPMLIDFSAEWCVACKKLERYTFSDRRVIELAERFVTVRVDATRRTPEIAALEKKYGIAGLPWVAFVAADGRILSTLTVTGFVDAEAMLERMRAALPEGQARAASLTP